MLKFPYCLKLSCRLIRHCNSWCIKRHSHRSLPVFMLLNKKLTLSFFFLGGQNSTHFIWTKRRINLKQSIPQPLSAAESSDATDMFLLHQRQIWFDYLQHIQLLSASNMCSDNGVTAISPCTWSSQQARGTHAEELRRERQRKCVVNCVSRSLHVLNTSLCVIHSKQLGRQWSAGSRLVTLNKPCPIPQAMEVCVCGWVCVFTRQ